MGFSETTASASASAAVYIPFVLGFYDRWVLRLCNTYVWHCPTAGVLLPFFRRHMSHHHLDVGVGTGFYPSEAMEASTAKSTARDDLFAPRKLALVDLNGNSLASASRLIAARHPDVALEVVQADALRQLPPPLAGRRFDSISVYYLVHCLAGPPRAKSRLWHVLKHHLTPGGVLFGATILGCEAEDGIGSANGGDGNKYGDSLPQRQLMPLNWLGKVLMWLYNTLGIFGNREDSKDAISEGLKEAFEEIETKVVGRVMLFQARQPRKARDYREKRRGRMMAWPWKDSTGGIGRSSEQEKFT